MFTKSDKDTDFNSVSVVINKPTCYVDSEDIHDAIFVPEKDDADFRCALWTFE